MEEFADIGEAAVATTVATAAERIGKATTGAGAIAQGAARSAVVVVTVSSLRDVPTLVRGDMSVRDFAENRGVDAAEAATATAVAGAATSIVLATGAGGAASAAVGGAAASAAAAGAAAAAGTGTAAGTAAAAALGGVIAAAAGPALIGGTVVVGTGLLVGAGFAKLRKHVRANQEQRRGRTATTESAAPKRLAMPDTRPQQIELTLRGANVFTPEQATDIRAWLAYGAGAEPAERAHALRRLREMRFLVSDWAPRDEPFGRADFDALVGDGYIVSRPANDPE